jgi:hypothetical protein
VKIPGFPVKTGPNPVKMTGFPVKILLNGGISMSDNSSESPLDWLDKVEDMNRMLLEDPNMTQVNRALKLKVSEAHVSYLASIRACLDPAAIQRIRSAAKEKPGYILSYSRARALAGLKCIIRRKRPVNPIQSAQVIRLKTPA